MALTIAFTLALTLGLPGRSAAQSHTVATGWFEAGIASVYAAKFQGRRTANGELYNASALTAAHPSLPFGSVVRVTSLTNGKSVVVRINDRGPFVQGRIIDVSRAAAQVLGFKGLREVEIEQLR